VRLEVAVDAAELGARLGEDRLVALGALQGRAPDQKRPLDVSRM